MEDELHPIIHICGDYAIGIERGDIEEALIENFEGYIEPFGSGQGVDGWHIDLEVIADQVRDDHIEKLRTFLRTLSTPRDAYIIWPRDRRRFDDDPPLRTNVWDTGN